MNAIEKVICFKVSNPHSSVVYRYMFRYGNGTCVAIYRDGEILVCVDTRYDKSVIKAFRSWCVDWIVANSYLLDVRIEHEYET